ncbi:MAG: ECF transporter S component [Coriobacteriaceae bacterium]|uniref:ECF transporter S component n=1 Tax=Tractidigestivibacter sp. TaxID=2847320 RepID=UPI002A806AE0|nr:ECF transporter S component [Tractidigestivibacter sp.]MCI6274683.1 ECF transporter S component [Coriobacteriaceae bacterium]MCI6548564.1 ECF transporter S component [Coriobacteriaceae bacterium]MDY4534638.1 ECF transporter S component [Tractidigestivibacter sp.]MDY5270984.1 ECF transporter S component [Tractidigestivibacter sp.]
MAPTSTHNATHSTHAASGWGTRRIAVTALLCAMAAICTLVLEFPILPGVTWLKYDPSGIVALIAGLAFGPATGAAVSVIPYLVHVATASGVYGMVMAVLATFSLVMPASLVYRRHRTMHGALIGLVVGGIVCLAACVVGNLIVTPFYTGMPLDAVIALIVPALLPFNIIKIIINCAVFALVMRPIFKAMGVEVPTAGNLGTAR